MAAPPFKVKAIYEYTSAHDDDLTFPVGQIITVTELEGDEWYVGEYTSVTGEKHEGLFPSNFVEKYEPEVPVRPSRAPRQKPEVQQAPAPAPIVAPVATEPEEEDTAPTPPAIVTRSPPVDSSRTRSADQEAKSPPPAPKPTPAEPAEAEATPAKKPPPPVAAKSNAFKDRIAAFNQPAAAPIAPMQPGRQNQPSNFIKKPFVAPPPSKNAYIPPAPKVEPVHKPYVREEDPEIREREEEDRAAAEAAGLGGDTSVAAASTEEGEGVPKPMTLKERMALLQQQQQEQAQRRAEIASKKKPPPQKKASESSDVAAAGDVADDEIEGVSRQSSDLSREKPRVPSTSQRRLQEPMSPVPAVPDHEVLSDGHEADQSGAGDLTEEDDTGTLGPDSDERAADNRRSIDEAGEAEPEEEEEDEVDEETRRKEELRARMARLGGGMPGMGAPFNPFGAPPPAPSRKKQPARERDVAEDAPSSAPQIPQMVPVPGMSRVQSPPVEDPRRLSQADDREDEDEEESAPPPPPKRTATAERAAPPVPRESRPVPPAPQERGAPPVPSGAPRPTAPESRPVPPPPPAAIRSPGPGSESDDEMSTPAKRSSAEISGGETPMPIRPVAPPVAGPRDMPPRPDDKRSSYFSGSEPTSATSERRTSRIAPPVPGGDSAALSRPPPPPPPAQAPPSRQSTAHNLEPDESLGSDYDGDYDTDIASSAKHKDALKAPHYRDPSLTEGVMTDLTPVSSPPPLPPQASAPRAVPPPPPPQSAPKPRQSMDRPPPPVPPPRDEDPEEDYDPYRYTEGPRPGAAGNAPGAAPPPPPQRALPPDPGATFGDDQQTILPPQRRSTERAPTAMAQAMGGGLAATGRASTDLQRNSSSIRRSAEQPRPSGEHGQMAADINLSQGTPWWTALQPLPPALQDRNGIDILSECEETSKSKRGGKKEITKDIYVLYMDYSQTIISARYDSQDPADVQLEQRHEPPPPRLRQDQLEAAWQQFGSKISDAANGLGQSKKDATVGNGSPFSLPLELVKAQPNALLPVGTRAYGALVYANLANASTMQYDEIRRGDIVTLRNARFEGHHGAMKSKYKSDYGPGHVAVVEEWDGTRRAVRAWEQGREKKGGVRSEKFRLGDLRSGEVRIWRVVGRDWVGWES